MISLYGMIKERALFQYQHYKQITISRINKMIGYKMSTNQIYQYLAQKNFNLSSDRVLKQPHLNSETIWNIMAFLSNNIKDTKYEQIQPFIFSLLSPETHKQSLKRIKQYITISDAIKKSSKTTEQYPIKQILRPDREWILQRITLLINCNKFYQKVSKQYESNRTQLKLKKNLIHQLRKKYQQKLQQVQEIKQIKQKQKTEYEQKIQSIENITKQLNYKKKQKLDLLNSQQLLENQLKKKNKIAIELGYNNDDINIKIKQLEREVIRNAPKLKKERYAVIQQYEGMVKGCKEQFQLWATKINVLSQKIKPFIGIKQRSKTLKIEQRIKQLQNASNQLSQLNNKVHNDKQSKQGSLTTKKQLLKFIQNLEKDKKQITQAYNQQERQLVLLETSQRLLKDEERKHISNVKILEDKNCLAKTQYKALEDKIKHRSQKHRQKIIQMALRLKNIETESKKIIEEAFMEFN